MTPYEIGARDERLAVREAIGRRIAEIEERIKNGFQDDSTLHEAERGIRELKSVLSFLRHRAVDPPQL